MRSKDNILMEQIGRYIDDYYLCEQKLLQRQTLQKNLNFRSSAYRYLVSMAERKIISYAGES